MRVLRGTAVTAGRGRPGGGRPYQYKGTPGWRPESLPPMEEAPKQPGPMAGRTAAEVREEAAARRGMYAVLRAAGMTRSEAGAALGVTAPTVAKYERWLREREAR